MSHSKILWEWGFAPFPFHRKSTCINSATVSRVSSDRAAPISLNDSTGSSERRRRRWTGDNNDETPAFTQASLTA